MHEPWKSRYENGVGQVGVGAGVVLRMPPVGCAIVGASAVLAGILIGPNVGALLASGSAAVVAFETPLWLECVNLRDVEILQSAVIAAPAQEKLNNNHTREQCKTVICERCLV